MSNNNWVQWEYYRATCITTNKSDCDNVEGKLIGGSCSSSGYACSDGTLPSGGYCYKSASGSC